MTTGTEESPPVEANATDPSGAPTEVAEGSGEEQAMENIKEENQAGEIAETDGTSPNEGAGNEAEETEAAPAEQGSDDINGDDAPKEEAVTKSATMSMDADSSVGGGVADDADAQMADDSGKEEPVPPTKDANTSDDKGITTGDESATSKEPSYSTRGRSSEKDASSKENFSARDTLEEIGRVKESSPAAMGVSFLESLSEEERRTRTRFVPDVDGMHSLRKHEIRDDITLARSLVSSAGVTSLKKSKGKRGDAMDVDEDSGASPSDDGSADMARPGTRTIELSTRDLVIPSNAFVSRISQVEGPNTSISSHKTYNGIKSPLLVESVTAFNPPRPPESIGAKKKHRMLRWERRPEDVEVDLNNYKKTVQRTRQELHKAEGEYSRLETIDAHLRWNFLNHLNLMNEEYGRLSEEIGAVQQECVKSSDLLTSRTRSRGAGKGSYVMKDVLGVLKQKGSENAEAMETNGAPPIPRPVTVPGIGGLAPSVFNDWNRKTRIKHREPASSWTVAGEKVKTPYGEGIVLEVFPPEAFKGIEKAKKTKETDEKAKDGEPEKAETGSEDKAYADNLCSYLPARASVKLPFGVGYFEIANLRPLENACVLSDTKLCERWENLITSALTVGGTIDLEGMNFNSREKGNSDDINGGTQNDEVTQMDVEDSGAPTTSNKDADPAEQDDEEDEDERFMPFGAGLLPTATGRGNLLNEFSITDIEKAMENGLYNGKGVLGKTSNQGVTEDFRKWEDEEQEYLVLQGDVLLLRNALVRQKRIRLLNERTDTATSDRYSRAADLVAEMRSDLKSLKHRLEDELKELGMDDEITKKILSQYYIGQDNPVDVGEASPLKRSRMSIADIQAGNNNDFEDDRGSTTDGQGMDDLSGDDMEAHRVAKKLRPNQ